MNKEEEKYYIPEFEEFYPGFECEWLCSFPEFPIQEEKKNNSIPEYRRITVGLDFEFTQLPERLKYDNYRVKYLDKEDIESLGWKVLPLMDGFGSSYFGIKNETSINGFTYWELCWLQGKIRITRRIEAGYDNSTYQIFNGSIKNKSELKRLMDQLGVKRLL